MNIEIILGVTSFFTSLIAGVVGFGGGMLLIAVLPIFLSANIIIPIHGITQIASNSSRMVFSISHVQWSLFPKFLAGSMIGTLLFGVVLFNMPTDYVPVAIGTYIIFNLWSSKFAKFMRKFESYYLIGFVQTGLGLIVGATGPLSLSVLTKELKSNNQIIATSSMFMTISHLAKIPVYMSITPFLQSSIFLIFTMVFGSVLGSFCGTKLRLKADNEKLIFLIKILLTLLATNMLIGSFVN